MDITPSAAVNQVFRVRKQVVGKKKKWVWYYIKEKNHKRRG